MRRNFFRSAAIALAVETPDVAQRLAVQRFYPVRSCGADFAATIRQYDDYGRVIRETNITLQRSHKAAGGRTRRLGAPLAESA